MHEQSTPRDPEVLWGARATDDRADAWERYRAQAPGVYLVGVELPFDDVLALCLLWTAAQALLLAIVGIVAGVLWLLLT